MSHINMTNLADVLAIEKKSLAEYLGNQQTTYAIIQRAADQFADRTALIFLPLGDPLADLSQSAMQLTYTYRELLAGIHQTANLLQQLGIKKGDTVSYILPNSIESYLVLYGAQAVGIANPISPMLPLEHMQELLQCAESKVLITMGEDINPGLWQNILSLRQRCPKLEKILVIGGKDDPTQRIFSFHALLTQQATQPQFDVQQIHPHDVCSYFHTSGTTGKPKLAKHTHYGNAYMAWAMDIAMGYARPNNVVLSGLPMFHVGAPMVSGLAAFIHGGTVVTMSPFGWMDEQVVANFWRIVEKYQGTTTTALPFIFRALNAVPVNGANIQSLCQAISGMAVSVHDFIEFKEKTGVAIANLWGQTEVIVGTFNPDAMPNDPHFGSMGFRLPFERLKAVRLNAHGEYLRDCAVGEAGVLCIKGPNVAGYKDPELNRQRFVQEGWLNAGDWVRQEADGYFTILGRAEDFIQRPNLFISLLEIEHLAVEHPLIAEVTAVSVADAKLGMEVPVLYAVLKTDADITAENLYQWLKAQWKSDLAAMPTKVILCKNLPKNGMGKPLKYVLREQFGLAETV